MTGHKARCGSATIWNRAKSCERKDEENDK
nr:MAG TPA: hypothetical protein [Caudoviricetes sp.]